MRLDKKRYSLGNGQEALSYEISDENGHTIQISEGEEIVDLLIALQKELEPDEPKTQYHAMEVALQRLQAEVALLREQLLE